MGHNSRYLYFWDIVRVLSLRPWHSKLTVTLLCGDVTGINLPDMQTTTFIYQSMLGRKKAGEGWGGTDGVKTKRTPVVPDECRAVFYSNPYTQDAKYERFF